MRRRRRTSGAEPLRFNFEPPPKATGRPRRPRRRRIRRLRFLAVLMLLVLLGCVSAFFGFMTAIAQDLPRLDQFHAARQAQIGHIYAPNPKGGWIEIGTLASADARTLVGSSQISPIMKQAIVAVEDKRFYQHRGVDPIGLLRAIFLRITTGATQGGSTITEQFVKNTFLSPEQTIQRKIKEAALAYQLEQRWSKDHILTEYLNTIYFGHGTYGIESAAEYYFGTTAAKLTPAQAALLASLPKSPTEYDPLTHPSAARERRSLVLDDMVAQGYITAEQGSIAKAQPLVTRKVGSRAGRSDRTRFPYFVQYVTEQLVNRYGTAETFGGGLKVYTTLDIKEQRLAEQRLFSGLKGVGPQGSLVSIDPQSGQVKALVGGDDYTKSQFDTATEGHRQPGSSFKPFVLLAGLQKGIQLSTEFESKVHHFDLGNGNIWSPTNDTPAYLGNISLTTATKYSDNTVFAQLTMAVGPASVAAMAHRLGITSPLDTGTPAIGLGGLRLGVTPLEMAHAYATIANGGVRVGGSILFHTADSGISDPSMDPISITKIRFPNGTVAVNSPERIRAVPETDALATIEALKGVLSPGGTGQAAAMPGRPAAGKTGTTSNFADAWFVGFTPQRVAAVWVGYVNPVKDMKTEYHGKPVFGGTYPAEIWKAFMTTALANAPALDWPAPALPYSVPVFIDTRTWTRAPAGCPAGHTMILAAALVPTQASTCPLNLVRVPDLTGLGPDQAASILQSTKLRLHLLPQPAGPGDKLGLIAAQTPLAMQSLPPYSAVTALVAVPTAYAVVPKVSGGLPRPTLAQALVSLRTARFRVELQPGAAGRRGAVLSQLPAAGAHAPYGSVVVLRVAGRVPAVRLPPLAGVPYRRALRALAALGLRGVAVRAAGPARAGDVVYLSAPRAGALVPLHGGVQLTVGPR